MADVIHGDCAVVSIYINGARVAEMSRSKLDMAIEDMKFTVEATTEKKGAVVDPQVRELLYAVRRTLVMEAPDPKEVLEIVSEIDAMLETGQ